MSTDITVQHPPALCLAGVNKSYGKGETALQVLFDINLTLQGGEMVLITGPSGCGKTTLISLIAGVLDADNGEINVLGQPLHAYNGRQKTLFRKQNLGFIFQQFNLLPTLTVTENIAVPLLIAGENYETALAKAAETADTVGLGNRLDFLPVNLSGGQQQRVAIARALVRDPKLIICDEPTAALDGHTGQTVMQLLQNVAVMPGRLVLVVTHDNRITHFGNREVQMEDGRILKVHTL